MPACDKQSLPYFATAKHHHKSHHSLLVFSTAPHRLLPAGCTGSRTSRPSSRFLRHKAPRLQEGGLTDAGLRGLAGSGSNGNGGGGSGAAMPAGQPAGLQSLNVGALSITDGVLAVLPTSLTSLQLSGCKRVGDSGVLQVLACCPTLARFDASGCSQLTAAGLGCYSLQQQQQQGSGASSSFGSWEEAQQQSPGATSGGAPCSERARHGAATGSGREAGELAALGGVHSTATHVRLRRAALPRQACTREALAWLAGLAASSTGSGHSAGSGSGGSGGPAGRAQLQRLELASGAALRECELVALLACCPQLAALQLSSAGAAGGALLCATVAQRCRLVSRLTLGGASTLGDSELALLLRELPALQHLDLSGSAAITGAAVLDMQAARQTAGVAGVDGGSGSSDAGGGASGAAVAAFELGLRTLRLEGCSVGDAAVQALATGLCPHLEILSLRRCPRVSGAGAGAALHGCRALRQLLLGGSGVADCAAAPAPPRPSQFSLVELPARAARHVLRWQALLVYAD